MSREAQSPGLTDALADAVLEAATLGRSPAAIAASLGVPVQAVLAVIDERPSATCSVCCLRVRARPNGTTRWHVQREGETRRCKGSGKRGARSTSAEVSRLVRAAKARAREQTTARDRRAEMERDK